MANSLFAPKGIPALPSSPPLEGAGEPLFPTGIEPLDLPLGGGLIRGGITELVGRPSSGKTGLLLSILARVAQQGELIAYLDLFRCFDPESAARSSLDLSSFLWIRPPDPVPPPRLLIQGTFRALDLLVRAGNFGAVVVDLERADGKGPRLTPPYPLWYRLRKALRHRPTMLLVVAERSLAGSAASTVLACRLRHGHWNSPLPGPQYPLPGRIALLRGALTELEVLRGKGCEQSGIQLYRHFQF